MTVTQVKDLMNEVTREVLGEENIVNENLSNVVDIGTQIFNSSSVDSYVKSLVNHIGRVIFVNRVYRGSAPSVLMDGWEFGSVLEKITADLPEATDNESWELENNTSYDPNIFYKPTVSVKFFNNKVTFEIPCSFTEKQVKQSFSNSTQLNAFLSMIYNAVEKSLTVKIDSLIMRTINNFISETIYNEYGSASLGSKSGIRAINALYLYNNKFNKSLTANNCIYDKDFYKYLAYIMATTKTRMGKISKRYNIGGRDRFTSEEDLHVVLLADFAQGANIYLQSDTFHNDFVKLPNAEIVSQWQGSGTASDEYPANSTINVTNSAGHTVNTSGILGVMFDRDALGVCNIDRRVTTNYNPKAEFYTNWYKFDAGYFNDFNENFVVFFVA